MALTYTLRPYPLDDDPNSYRAAVVDPRSLTLDDVIDQMIHRGSTVTRAEAFAVLEEYNATIEALLRQGYHINTPLLNYRLAVRGLFDGPDDLFDPARHQVYVSVKPGPRLRKIGPQVAVERVQFTPTTPQPFHFNDLATGTRDATVTPGGLARLKGLHLKYDETDLEQGIFFVDAAQTATRVTVVETNLPRRLAFLIPPGLASGTYTVEVRAVLRNTNTFRIGRLPHTLTVP